MDNVRVATWNMGGGEGPSGPTEAQVEAVLTRIYKKKVSLLLGQECQKEFTRRILRELGFELHAVGPERLLVAWLPELWTSVHKEDVVLNPTSPFRRKGGSDVYCHMPHVILCNDEGVSLDVGSYHTPSSVQERNRPENRIKALREAMRTLSGIAADSKCHASLFGGDDNVDEEGGAFGPWDFMLFQATGLRQITAPKNTLGKRKVDDFRVRNLKPVGAGAVIQGPTHHNVHIQTLRLPA